MKKATILYLALVTTAAVMLFVAQATFAADEPDATDDSTAAVFLPMITGSGQIPPTTPGDPPVIDSFTANPATIQKGASSTLSWQVIGATALSISPNIGSVNGTSISVAPTATTEYTLMATNGAGSVTERATVSVFDPPQNPDGFFLIRMSELRLPTSHPSIAVDSAGGVHVAFVPESATNDDPRRPAYYAYCPSNCTSAEAFTIVHLGDGLGFASLALNAAGQPRILVRKPAPSGYIFTFQYWECDSGCLNPSQWRSGDVGYTYGRPVGWVEPFIHSFALDHLDRPRFIYYDNGADSEDTHWGAYYAYCNSDCTTTANWYETRLLDDKWATDFDLAFGPNGQPRLVYSTYDSTELTNLVAYADCEQNCASGGNWSTIVLVSTASASVSSSHTFALALDATGQPRLALYAGTGIGGSPEPNYLYYLACDAAQCAQPQMWSVLRLNLPMMRGEEGVALVIDSQNRPRIVYHAPLTAGFGLFYAWCNANCAASAEGWQSQKLEASEKVDAELPIPPRPGCSFPQCDPPIPPCTVSFWDSGVRPALALDAAGNPRIAYDANHEQGGGCGTFIDTKATRFIQFNQP